MKSRLIKFEVLFIVALVIAIIGYAAYDLLKAPVIQKTKENPTSAFSQPNQLNDSIVEFGMTFLNTPYVAGGCSKDGFDCSGFVYFVYRHFDIETPRSSADFEHFGKEIPIADIRKGDMVLFLSPTRSVIGHIGIVTTSEGKNSDFIHATSGREMKVVISNLATEGYKNRFVKAIRVI